MVLLISVEFFKKQDIDWRPTFSTFDKIPYGTAVNYRLAAEGKWNNIIERTNKTFYQYSTEDSSNFSPIFMVNRISFDDESFKQLLLHVENGNTVFMASNTPSSKLLDYFDIDWSYKSADKEKNLIELENGISFVDTLSIVYRTERFPYFTWNDSNTNITQLGSRNNNADFIEILHGKGKFMVHVNPVVFTNYYLLHQISFEYVNSIFAMLPGSRIVWDDYLNYGHRKPPSEMRFVLSSIPMRMAFYIITFLILLYLGLAWRRKQRMIPVLEPIKNSSIHFISTLTNLYLSNKNNRIIALYLIKNFRIKMNRKYLIHWNKSTDTIKEQLINKSGKSELEVEKLLQKLTDTEQHKTVSQTELVELNNTIEEFISK